MTNNQQNPARKRGFFKGLLYLAALASIIFAVVGGLTWANWHNHTTWPQFPSDLVAGQTPTAEQNAAAKSLAPEVAVKFDRDFGYRIGDIVEVTIFIKEKPGTEIDVHSMAVEGDFEVVGEPVIFERRTIDGARRLRADLKLQSFSAAPKLVLKANMSYRVKATNEDVTVTLPAFEAYTSNTWDGRLRIEDGHLAVNYGYEPFYSGGLVFGGLFCAVLFFVLARRYGREKAIGFELKVLPNRFLLARRDFNALWTLMEAGDRSADRYAELSQLLRRLYRIETKTTLEASYFLVYSYNGPMQVTDILRACDRVIYRAESLSEEEHLAIKATFDYLVPQYTPANLANLPATRVVLKSAKATIKSTSQSSSKSTF
jgi:hypothetical protein